MSKRGGKNGGKKNGGKKNSGGKNGTSQLGDAVPFSNNAFSGLSGLGGTLPSAPAPAPTPVAQTTPVAPVRFPNKLVVRMEKKGRRGKTVTRISGVPTKDLAALCKEMKKALGCGATIEDVDLILLGDLTERAVAWFKKAGATKLVRGT
jgi:translation initiation factor 1